jgi:demethylmenaquinone methyltransferase/2-methoxy-6-polyprenyl-1,4-benzoquinol methylase
LNNSEHNPEKINPYDNVREKGKQVEAMFDSIAPAYDFMNTAMTFGLHRWWKRVALKHFVRSLSDATKALLDVATGTGDLIFSLHKMLPHTSLTGIDLSSGMLNIAREKKASSCPNADIHFMEGDCLNLPFEDNSFDGLTVAYGVRNFENLSRGYQEMLRVLKPGGVLCVLELSVPAHQPFKAFYKLYSGALIPLVGKLVSGDSRAYSYLPESIAACPSRGEMTQLMTQAGFKQAEWKSLTFGVATIYLARK